MADAAPSQDNETWTSSTHREYVGEGYYVTVQHCERRGCDIYLGVNYPGRFCDEHVAESTAAPTGSSSTIDTTDALVEAVDTALAAWREYRLAEHSVRAHQFGQVSAKRGRVVLAMEHLGQVRSELPTPPTAATGDPSVAKERHA